MLLILALILVRVLAVTGRDLDWACGAESWQHFMPGKARVMDAPGLMFTF